MLDDIVREEKIALTPVARAAIDPRMIYARHTLRDGNILRRPDRNLAHREDWLQLMLNLAGHFIDKSNCAPLKEGTIK